MNGVLSETLILADLFSCEVWHNKKKFSDPNVEDFKDVYKTMMKWLKNRVQKARAWYKKHGRSIDVRPGMAVPEILINSLPTGSI